MARGGTTTDMWLFLQRRLRRYLLLVIALPVVGHLLVRAGAELETRRGPSSGTDRLQRTGRFVLRHTDRRRGRPA